MGEEESTVETSATRNEKEGEKPLGEFLEISENPHSITYQPENGKLMSLLNPNVYATKKTIAQGMLDVALFTANASQLKYLLHMGTRHEFYYLLVTLISISIILQISAGVVIVMKSRFNINKECYQLQADSLNNALTWIIFGLTVLNLFISSFGVDLSSSMILIGALFIVIGRLDVNREKHQPRANSLNNIITIGIFVITIVNILIASFGMKNSDNLATILGNTS